MKAEYVPGAQIVKSSSVKTWLKENYPVKVID